MSSTETCRAFGLRSVGLRSVDLSSLAPRAAARSFVVPCWFAGFGRTPGPPWGRSTNYSRFVEMADSAQKNRQGAVMPEAVILETVILEAVILEAVMPGIAIPDFGSLVLENFVLENFALESLAT